MIIVDVTGSIRVRTKYGERQLEEGMYAYVGSAFGSGGLRARISRHWKKDKKKHWHIDWITTSDRCEHVGAYVFVGEHIEANLAEILGNRFTPIPGFGASDSKEDSHLFKIC